MKMKNLLEKQYFLDIFENLKTNISKEEKEIKFNYIENIVSSDMDNIYIHDNLEAYIDNKKVGIMSVIYTNNNLVKERYPTFFHCLYNELIPKRYRFYPLKITEFSKDEFLLFSKALGLFKSDFDIDKEDIHSIIYNNREEIKDFIKEKHDKYKDFINYFKNKPYVFSISCEYNDNKGLLEDNKGKGIGFSLYCEMAKNLYKKDLNLYAANCQSKYEKNLWFKFETGDFIEFDDESGKYFNVEKRRFINFEKLVLYLEQYNLKKDFKI